MCNSCKGEKLKEKRLSEGGIGGGSFNKTEGERAERRARVSFESRGVEQEERGRARRTHGGEVRLVGKKREGT